MRVVATRIEWDGTMLRRVVDTAQCGNRSGWEDLACRALTVSPPYRPVPGVPLYHVSLDAGAEVLVAAQDLAGPLLDLVTAVLMMGEEVLAPPTSRLAVSGTPPVSPCFPGCLRAGGVSRCAVHAPTECWWPSGPTARTA